MERMIKRIAIRKDGTISMSEFRNFAEEYQGKINELEEENRKLRDYADNLDSENDNQAIEIEELKKENKNLKGLQICGKTVAEWIEEDKKVIRVDKNGKVVSGGEFRELC